MNLRAFALIVVVLALTSGCASPGRKYDSGAETHRMIIEHQTNNENQTDSCSASGHNAATRNCATDQQCAPSRSCTSFVKFVSAQEYKTLNLVNPGDSVSIRINSIYICDFAESNPFPENFTLWLQDLFLRAQGGSDYPPKSCSQLGIKGSKHYTRGELVVLADVFEQGGGRTIEYSKNSFEQKSARVIYYDDDVRESGQFLNLANIPVYGPIRYSGNPLFFRIFMLELDDEENAQTSAMLKKLAEIGGKAYPPASPVLKTLSSIGDALLSGEQDDLEFRYTMVFDPIPSESANYLPLAVGDYIILKQENRSQDFDWSNQNYDSNTGNFSAQSEESAHRRFTFVSFKVAKNEPALQQDGLQLYSEFEKTLPAAGIDLSTLDHAADSLQTSYKNLSALDTARGDVQTLNKQPQDSTAYQQAQQSLFELICDSAEIPTHSGDGSGLVRADIEYLLRSLKCVTTTNATFSQWIDICKTNVRQVCTSTVAEPAQP